jgi:hypothetical protein
MTHCHLPLAILNGDRQDGFLSPTFIPFWFLILSVCVGIVVLFLTPFLSQSWSLPRIFFNFVGAILLFPVLPLFFRAYHCAIPRIFRGQEADARRLSDVEPVFVNGV